MTTQELTKEVMGLKGITERTSESCEHAHDRIDAVEQEQKEQRGLLTAIQKIADGLENVGEKVACIDKKVDGLGTRITAIEQEPAGKWKTFTWAAFMIVVGAAVGYILGQIGLKP